jgi:hypothetical protein
MTWYRKYEEAASKPIKVGDRVYPRFGKYPARVIGEGPEYWLLECEKTGDTYRANALFLTRLPPQEE